MKTEKKIFQIGFNKCGTLSIHEFLLKNGIRSVHYKRGELASKIFENHKKGINLLDGLDEYDAFSDMELLTPDGFLYVAYDLFKALHQSYPDAIFILNTRPVDDWINSRLRHGGGDYLDRYRCILEKSKEDIVATWREQYFLHVDNVLTYFSKHEDSNFIHLNLSSCDPDTLGVFLKNSGLELSYLYLPHIHRSPSKGVPEKKEHLSRLLDAALYFKDIKSDVSKSLFVNALKIDPNNVYAQKNLTNRKRSLIKGFIRRLKFCW